MSDKDNSNKDSGQQQRPENKTSPEPSEAKDAPDVVAKDIKTMPVNRIGISAGPPNPSPEVTKIMKTMPEKAIRINLSAEYGKSKPLPPNPPSPPKKPSPPDTKKSD